MNNKALTETEKKIFDVRCEKVQDFAAGVAEGWDSWTMDQISKEIVSLTDMLPAWVR